MKGATKTRTQRRMEKKQALILLVLVLVVSLASFTLGVIVGRQGAERDLVLKQQAAEKILVAPAPKRAAPAPPIAGTDQNLAEQAKEETKLTFYDDLNKQGTAPLGSGINLPPVEPKPEPVVKPPLDLPEQPIVKKEAAPQATQPAPAVEKTETAMADTALIVPKVDPQGKFVLQVGSFSTAGDAGKLKQRLLGKNYPVFVAEADLGKKGIWYRVRLGPYADGDAAKAMQQLLEKQEQMKGFVTRK